MTATTLSISLRPRTLGNAAARGKGIGGQVLQESAQEGVRAVYDAHFGRLVGWTTSLVGDRDLAHDFATEAFVKLWNHWTTVEDPRAWLYTTVANLVRDHWRKRAREHAAYDRLTAGGPVGPDAPSPERDHAMTLSVRDAVQSLPDRLRMAVLLHYFADLSVAQVAGQLGKSEGAVKRDLYDARKLLASRLEGVR